MTKFAAFSLVLFVLVISSIYKVNSAPQRFREGRPGRDPWAWDPQVPQVPVRRSWGFRALGVNYYYMSYFYILSILIIATILN